jgi:hypothetical protein
MNVVANIFAMHRATEQQKAEILTACNEVIEDSKHFNAESGSTFVIDADGLGMQETTGAGSVIGWFAAKCECGKIDIHQGEFNEDLTCCGCDGVLTVQDRRSNRLSGYKPGFKFKY